jgi:nucleotide-binding universal stress UspA family protein
MPELDVGDGCSSILVAVNGRASGWQALDWAAAESAVRGCPLRIIHVIHETLLIVDPLGAAALAFPPTEVPTVGERILEEAATRALLLAPGAEISTCLEVGGTAATVRRTGRVGALTVVGRGRSKRLGILATARRIGRRARGPVAIVELGKEPKAGPSAGRVVLGIDDFAGPPAAVVYAFQAASRRGVGLTVIHSCAPWTGQSRRRGATGRIVDDLRKLAAIDNVLQGYADAYPDVDLRRRFVTDSAGPALVAESDAAALLVVGARVQSWLSLTRLGPVARMAVRRARCSIAVIRPPQPARPASARDGSRNRGIGRLNLGTASDA